MKIQDIMKSLLNAFLIYSLAIFISCASQETIDQSAELEGDASGEMAEADSEELGLLEEGDDFAEGGDLAVDELEGAEEEQELAALEGELAEEGGDELSMGEGGDEFAMDEGGLEGGDEFAMDEGEFGEEGLEGGEEGEELAADELSGGEIEGAEVAALEGDSLDSGLDEMADGATELSDPPAEDAGFGASSEDTFAMDAPSDLGSPSDDAGLFDNTTTSFDSTPSEPKVIISSTPQIPTQAMDKGGVLLNRYYFVRQGDTPESVSQLLYGTTQRSGDLTAWNSGSFRAGKVVYYSSPSDASDYQMRSFYQERGITPESYVVQSGDWLSVIAERRYGNIRSWKEIAVTNGLPSPDALTNGQEISLYPSDLSVYADGQAFAQNTAPAPEAQPMVANNDPMAANNEPMAEQQMFQPEQPGMNDPMAQVPPPANDFAPPPQPQMAQGADDTFSPPPPVAKTKSKKRRKKASATGKLIQKNLFSFAVGGIIVFLLLSLLVINRRKRAAAAEDEFHDEDTYSPQSKAR